MVVGETDAERDMEGVGVEVRAEGVGGGVGGGEES